MIAVSQIHEVKQRADWSKTITGSCQRILVSHNTVGRPV